MEDPLGNTYLSLTTCFNRVHDSAEEFILFFDFHLCFVLPRWMCLHRILL